MQKREDLGFTVEKALNRLRKYCAYQERCHSEVRSKLLELKIYGDDLEEIISILIQDNYLNEERFAQSFVRGKYRFKKWGRAKIIRMLKQKRISDYCIRKGIKEIDEEEYLNNLDNLIEKKQAQFKPGENKMMRYKKLRNYIISKGYEVDEFKKAIDRLPLDD